MSAASKGQQVILPHTEHTSLTCAVISVGSLCTDTFTDTFTDFTDIHSFTDTETFAEYGTQYRTSFHLKADTFDSQRTLSASENTLSFC